MPAFGEQRCTLRPPWPPATAKDCMHSLLWQKQGLSCKTCARLKDSFFPSERCTPVQLCLGSHLAGSRFQVSLSVFRVAAHDMTHGTFNLHTSNVCQRPACSVFFNSGPERNTTISTLPNSLQSSPHTCSTEFVHHVRFVTSGPCQLHVQAL